MFIRLGAMLGLWPLVWIRLAGEGVHLLRSKRTVFGKWIAMAGGLCLILREDGSVATKWMDEEEKSSRIHLEWKEWKRNRVHVTFPTASGAPQQSHPDRS